MSNTSYLGGAKAYVVNLSGSGAGSSNVFVVNSADSEAVPVRVVSMPPISVNFPGTMDVRVINTPQIQSILNPVTVTGSVTVSGSVGITGQPIQVRNETGGSLVVEPKAGSVWTVAVPGTVNVQVAGGSLGARVWNRTATGGSPDYDKLYTHITNPSLTVNLGSPVTVSDPIRVRNAAAPDDKLAVSIQHPTYGSPARVRVGLDGETVSAVITNSQTAQSQHVPVYIGSWASGVRAPIESATYDQTRVAARIDQIQSNVRHFVFNQQRDASGNYGYPSPHTDTRILAHVVSPPEGGVVRTEVTNAVDVKITDGNINLNAELIDHRRFQKTSSNERIHRGFLARASGVNENTTWISNPQSTAGSTFAILGDIAPDQGYASGSLDPNALLVRYFLDTRVFDTTSRYITQIFYEVGSRREYIGSLLHFRQVRLELLVRFVVDEADYDPWVTYDQFRSNAPTMPARLQPRLGLAPSVVERSYRRLEGYSDLYDWQWRGFEPVLSVYRVEPVRLDTNDYWTAPYSFGGSSAGWDLDAASNGDTRLGYQRYGRLVGRYLLGLDQSGVAILPTPVAEHGKHTKVFYSKAGVVSAVAPGSTLVFELDFRNLLKSGALGPAYRTGSAYLAKGGTPVASRTPVLSNGHIYWKGAIHGMN